MVENFGVADLQVEILALEKWAEKTALGERAKVWGLNA